MPDWKNEIRIAASPQEVWEALVDYPNAHHWQPNVKRAAIETSRSFGTGSLVKVEGKVSTTYLTVLESIPPRRLSLNVDQGGATGTSLYILSKDGAGTLVEHNLHLDMNLAAQLLSTFIAPNLTKELTALKKWVEKQA